MEKRGEEDYLRAAYELNDGKGVRSVDISRKLKISRASVSEMIRKLSKKGFINLKPYSRIFFTEKGKKEAGRLFDRYYKIKRFIEKFLRRDSSQSKEEAHKLEHFFSEETMLMIEKLIESENFSSIPRYVG